MNNQKQLTRVALSVAIAAVFLSGTAMAQDSAQDTATNATPKTAQQKKSDAKNTQNLEQVVVTGSASGVKKIDASYSITSASAQQIKEANPKSTADLLKMAPGVFPESSGGQTGANIEVAGFPGGGDAPYFTLQLNGSPIYPMSSLSFMENSSMFRLDDTIDRAEFVLGGPAVLYGTGQPGLTANFLLREGTDVPSGDLGVTYGSEGMTRVDGFIGFKLADNWYASFGGFWRSSDGVRDPQFDADKGGSLSATLTHDFDSGSLMFYARGLRDHNQFVTDTPIYNTGRGQFENYPGFSALTGTFGSKADQYEFIETTPCTTAGCTPGGIPVNLAKGRGANVHTVGGNLDLDFADGWSLSDKFNFTGGQMNTVSFFSTGANPSTLGDYISGAEAANGISGVAATAQYTNGGAANMNENVTTQGLWYVHKRIQGATNEFHLSKELFDGNTLTVGNYTAVLNDHDTWFLGNNMLLQAKSNPNPISVTLANGDVLSSPQGFVSGATSGAIGEAWNGFNTAFFLTDTWKVDQWLFDGGIRVEHQDANGRVQNTATGDLDNNAATLYNNNTPYFVPGYTKIGYSKTAPSWTLGANYEINDHMSVYGRVNDGVHFPGFDDIRGSYPDITPVEKLHNMEVGFKYQAEQILVDVNAYRKLFTGVPYTIITDLGQQSLIYGSNTKGLNANITYKPFEHFTIALSGDFMDGIYTGNQSVVTYQAQDGSTQTAIVNGHVLQRQPRWQYHLKPAYDVPTAWGDMRFWVTYEYIGNRYGDLIESQPLGQYHDIGFGATADVGQNWELNLQGTNLTNQIGITEGNSRLFGSANANGVILARSIEGREVNFQVKYKF